MRFKSFFALGVFAVLGVFGTGAQAETVTVYSARNEQLIKPLFDAFTQETGVDVRFVTDKEGALLARLQAEGRNTPADLLITVDAGNLWQAAQQGALKPVQSRVLDANVPPHLRDPKGEWYGLSVRARTLFYSKARVDAQSLSSYEDLADPKWKGKLCLRTSKKVYNQSLVAMLIAMHGEAASERIVRGWIANLATDVFADDTALLKAIAAGQCDVGIANTYYYGRIVDKEPGFPVGIHWANQATDGVHVNVSGAGVVRHAKNERGAIRLLEWLSSERAQHLYTDRDLEYPANPKINPDALIAGWGPFKPNLINVAKAGELQATATRLMDRAGYR